MIHEEKEVEDANQFMEEEEKLSWLKSQVIGGNAHTSDSYVGRKTSKMVHEATDYVKKCMGGSLDDALIFCGSGTTAAIKRLQEVMGIWVPSTLRDRIIQYLKNEERWLVFVGPYEHHSNVLSWRQSTAEVIEIGLDNDGLVDMGSLRFQLEKNKSENRPMLGSFSACSNVTSIVVDTRAISRLLHHAPYMEMDMRSGDLEGYDAIFASPHKFLGGPGTPGILMMNKALYELRSSAPSTCGGGTVSYVNDFNAKDTLYYDDIEEREDAGTPPIIQKILVSLVFWVKEFIGHHLIDKLEEFYIEKALKRLLPNPNIWILGNTEVKRQAILSFLVFPNSNNSRPSIVDEGKRALHTIRESGKPLHGPFVAKLLHDLFGIQARGGCACAGPYAHRLLGVDENLSLAFRDNIKKGYPGIKPGWTRISFPYYMSREEFDFILSALEFVSKYGDRFLPLYSFNWQTGQWTFRRNLNMIHEEKDVEDANQLMEEEEKLRWLRSQVIGGDDFEFETPFGKRRLVYADHTASGRCLRYIEDYIIQNVLPFYGNTHTSDSYVGRKTSKMVHEATDYVKKCMGGSLDDALIFCGSGTTAQSKDFRKLWEFGFHQLCEIESFNT
ncbi:hypothetical protein C5167_037030 [Papaver somniferum]|uniref:Aminotransferase class V domain-containing protein n=1 Tax=Papaver somniferum TaxID=3469 RepID=A0A4Y7I7S4_PAPSO|nr:hypothetical protein C5167_037030 [Papaver somniferum]